MSELKSETTKAAKAEKPAEKKAPLGPTPEQLQSVNIGGDYLFDPQTGAFTCTRKPAKAAPNKQDS